MSSPKSDEIIATEPRYPTNGAKQVPFTFDSSGFTVSYIVWESGRSLRKLLFPELLPTAKARESVEKDVDIVDAPWVKAQLHYYGIEFKADLDPFKAKALLLTSVAHGLCDVVLPQILAIKVKLKEEYQAMLAKYKADRKIFHDSQIPGRVKKFELCSTPTEEAKCDPSLFLRKYFLDANGNPDRSKCPGLLLLPGYIDRGRALSGRTDRVPGLHVADGGLEGVNHVMVIGWDRIKINQKATDIDMEKSQGRGVVRLFQDWDHLMERHLKYLSKYPMQPFGVHETANVCNMSGVYALEAKPIQCDWPTIAKEMRLRMFSGGLAIFDLGIVVGMVIFAKTQHGLHEVLAKYQCKDGDWDSETEEEDSEDDESSDAHEGDDDTGSESSHESDIDMEDDLEIDPPSPLPPVKRQKLRSSNPGRVYFQWRGYNTQSGEIQFDPHDKNTGFVDFADINGSSFEGVIDMPNFGDAIPIQGFKIPGMAGPVNMDWNELSHLASEREKVPEHWV